jgi:hypothetical protein
LNLSQRSKNIINGQFNFINKEKKWNYFIYNSFYNNKFFYLIIIRIIKPFLSY